MEKEYSPGLKEIDSREILLIIKDMDMVLIIGKMEIDMKGIGMLE